MKASFAVLLAALFAPAAFASGVSCSSADQRVSYNDFRSDGGAHMSGTTVTLDGETVYRRINFDDQEHTANVAFGDKIDVAGPTTDANGVTRSTYVQPLTLTKADDAATVLFTGYVLCEAVQNPICMLCP